MLCSLLTVTLQSFGRFYPNSPTQPCLTKSFSMLCTSCTQGPTLKGTDQYNGYGQISRRNFEGRNLVTHWLRQVPQGIHHNHDIPHSKESQVLSSLPHRSTMLHTLYFMALHPSHSLLMSHTPQHQLPLPLPRPNLLSSPHSSTSCNKLLLSSVSRALWVVRVSLWPYSTSVVTSVEVPFQEQLWSPQRVHSWWWPPRCLGCGKDW